MMKACWFVCSLLVLAGFYSCMKNDNYAPILPPAPTDTTRLPDSLYAWQKIVRIPKQAIFDIWFVSNSQGYCATSDGTIYRSFDGGFSWDPIPNTKSAGIESIFFLDSQHGYAQGQSQFEITSDGGDHWRIKQFPTHDALNIVFVTPSVGYYSDVDSGVYKTTDTGTTWQQVYHPNAARLGFYTFFLDENNGWVATSDGNLSKTLNGFGSWESVASNIIQNHNAPNFNTLFFSDPQHGYYGNGTGLLKTVDGGQSWQRIHPAGGVVNIIRFTDANTAYYLSDTAIFKTTDAGQTWSTSCKLGNDVFYGMYFLNSRTGWACSQGGNVYRLSQ